MNKLIAKLLNALGDLYKKNTLQSDLRLIAVIVITVIFWVVLMKLGVVRPRL